MADEESKLDPIRASDDPVSGMTADEWYEVLRSGVGGVGSFLMP